jgi:glycosyltransferase involved in cell wall biosynthesis
MKILHAITGINRGGAENHLVDLIQGQVDRGHQIAVAYLKGNGYWQQMLESLGVRVIHLKLHYYGEIQPILRLRSLIENLKPDLVHAHLPPAELYVRLALLGLSSQTLPLIISKHNDALFYRGLGQQWVGSWVAKRAQFLIGISEAVKSNTCLQSLGCSPQKVVTIPYGIDPTPYEEVNVEAVKVLRSRWSMSDNTYAIGTVARLVPQKAIDTLLKGFSLYLKTAAQPAKLVIVGIGKLEAPLKQQARELGIQEQTIWAGFREDIPVVMNALDLFVLSSLYEGLGLVLLEAMAAAKPIVATRTSAIPETIEDRVTGLLVPPQRPKSLAEAFQFFEDCQARIHFGKAGRLRVKQKFTRDNAIDRTLSLYQSTFSLMEKTL